MKSFGIIVSLLAGLFFPAQLKAQNSLVISSPKAYAQTVQNWDNAVSQFNLDGVSWIGHVHGNGLKDRKHKNKSRDTVIYVPGTGIIQNDTMVILYFHGLGGFSKREFMNRIGPNLKRLSDEGLNYIFIFPELDPIVNFLIFFLFAILFIILNSLLSSSVIILEFFLSNFLNRYILELKYDCMFL